MGIARFRINEDTDIIYKCDTMLEVYAWLEKADMGLHAYYVHDVQDDIEVPADDVMDAYREGEIYEDLNAF